jgi:hypothetical protein
MSAVGKITSLVITTGPRPAAEKRQNENLSSRRNRGRAIIYFGNHLLDAGRASGYQGQCARYVAIRHANTNQSTFLHTLAGEPRSAKSLGGDFREWCDKAGLPERCSMHGLRKGCLRITQATGVHPMARADAHHTTDLSSLIRVRAAFEAAERDGLAPLAVLVDTPPSLDGGQAVAFDYETELA